MFGAVVAAMTGDEAPDDLYVITDAGRAAADDPGWVPPELGVPAARAGELERLTARIGAYLGIPSLHPEAAAVLRELQGGILPAEDRVLHEVPGDMELLKDGDSFGGQP